MKDVIVIGVDHGYAAMKTVHFSFPTGLVEYEHEPYTQKDVLEYNGRYYVVGSGRQPLQRDKTQTEDYYLLTLAAIAKELEHRGAEHTAQRPPGRGPAPDQLWPGQEVLPFIPVSGWKRYPFSLRGAGLHRHHPGGVPVSPGLCRRTDPDGTAGRAVRHCGGHWRLDGGSDAAG